MSTMLRSPEEVVALACGDIHLSHVAPIARSGEKSWYSAMQRPLDELKALQVKYSVPIIYCGDIFHTWKSCPELINFALEYLPFGYAIPGQHDLPLHNYEDIHKSAYWTLVKGWKIQNLKPGEPCGLDRFILYGFPWGFKVTKPKYQPPIGFNWAVIHSYIWTGVHKFPGADRSSRLRKWQGRLQGYTVAAYGDNHKGFLRSSDLAGKNEEKSRGCTILNCGAFLKRNADEANYQPCIGVVFGDGTVKRHKLDTSKDVISSTDEIIQGVVEGDIDLTDFLDELNQLGDRTASFSAAVHNYFRNHKVKRRIREIILGAIDGDKK